MHITVWNEFRHEKKNPKVTALYPNGIHTAIAEGLREPGLHRCAAPPRLTSRNMA